MKEERPKEKRLILPFLEGGRNKYARIKFHLIL